jgi:hypothetical protein
MSNYVNTLQGTPRNLGDGTDADSEGGLNFDYEKYAQDFIDKGADIAAQYAEQQAKDALGLNKPQQTVAQPQAPIVQPPARQVPTPAQTVQQQPAQESGGVMNTVISKVKQVPPILAAAVTGLATKYFSKSWLGALGVGAGTWFLTDKWQKS